MKKNPALVRGDARSGTYQVMAMREVLSSRVLFAPQPRKAFNRGPAPEAFRA